MSNDIKKIILSSSKPVEKSTVFFKKEKEEYWNSKPLLDVGAKISISYGKRGNGKTYGFLKEILDAYVEKNYTTAYLRRWDADIKRNKMSNMFSAFEKQGYIEKITDGKWNFVYYFSGMWYFAKVDEQTLKTKKDKEPFMIAHSLSNTEHNKGASRESDMILFFDEFIATMSEIPDEFNLFWNQVSTILRNRLAHPDAKIFMAGNTVNTANCYFRCMGLFGCQSQQIGTIDRYKFADSDMTIAVEYTIPNEASKLTDNYYNAFDDPTIKMITSGEWSLQIVPPLPCRYKKADIEFVFFINYYDNWFQGDIVVLDTMTFIFMHLKTTNAKHPDSDLIYSLDYDPRPNWHRDIFNPKLAIQKSIARYFLYDQVYYQDNWIGDQVKHYIEESKR